MVTGALDVIKNGVRAPVVDEVPIWNSRIPTAEVVLRMFTTPLNANGYVREAVREGAVPIVANAVPAQYNPKPIVVAVEFVVIVPYPLISYTAPAIASLAGTLKVYNACKPVVVTEAVAVTWFARPASVRTRPFELRVFKFPPWLYSKPPPVGLVVGTVVALASLSSPTPLSPRSVAVPTRRLG
jgi:hypothetical protein